MSSASEVFVSTSIDMSKMPPPLSEKKSTGQKKYNPEVAEFNAIYKEYWLENSDLRLVGLQRLPPRPFLIIITLNRRKFPSSLIIIKRERERAIMNGGDRSGPSME
jgi:hypothetical protein